MPLEIRLSRDHQGIDVLLPSGCWSTLRMEVGALAILRNMLVVQERAEVARALARRRELGIERAECLADALALGVGSDASPTQWDLDRIQRLPHRSRALARPQSRNDFNLEELDP